MLDGQHFLWPEPSVSDAKGQEEFVRAYDAQAHKIIDAIWAAVINAQAGLNWLSAQPPNLDEARRALNGIASNGKRAGEIVVRLRALMDGVPTADG